MTCYRFLFFIWAGCLPVLLSGNPWLAGPEVIRGDAEAPAFQGRVFHDLNGDGLYQRGEPGIPNVLVSNGRDIVRTDAEGRYRLPAREDMDLTLIQPSGWRVPTDERLVPQFFYVHKPSGSPRRLRFGGLSPTGPLPAAVNFPLQPCQLATGAFSVAALTDPQTYSNDEVGFFRDGVLRSLLNAEGGPPAALIMTGDIMGDDLDLLPRLLSLGATLRIPQYLVFGNHDLDFDAPDEASSADSWRRLYGPTYYAFEMGDTLFIVLNNVRYPIPGQTGRGAYNGALDAVQREWLENLIGLTAEDQRVVLAHHIPMVSFVDASSPKHQTDDAPEIYRLLGNRPALSLSGHTHTTENHAPGQFFQGWEDAVGVGPLPFRHLLLGAASGAWYQGDYNVHGVPMALQRMGAPPGYFMLEFQPDDIVETYVGAGFGDRAFWVGVNTPAFRSWFDSIVEWGRSPVAGRDPLPPFSIKDLGDVRLLTPRDLQDGVFLTANVWGGSAETTVEAHFRERNETLRLERTQEGQGESPRIGALWADPFAAQRQLSVARFAFASQSGDPRAQGFEVFRGSSFGPAAPQPMRSLADRNMHLWKVRLPQDLSPGIHTVRIASTDRHGRVSTEWTVLEVVETLPPRRWRQEPW